MNKVITICKYGVFGCLFFMSLTANASDTIKEQSTLVEQHILAAGRAVQGLALAEKQYYSATSTTLYRYDTNWKLLEQKVISIPLVNHMGAIDYHDGHIWAGFLNHGRTDGKYDPNLNRSIIAKIRAKDFEIVKTWDITKDLEWIDPVCFDGKRLWVGDSTGIFRYKLVDGELINDGAFRYPGEMGFSQGIRVVGNKLYTIHTFGSMDGLYEFDIPDPLPIPATKNQPTRVWEIQETKMHLEGFDFVPGHPNQIWEAQGSQVDRYELASLPEKNLPVDKRKSSVPATP